jgi:sterol-4alpha-carboxylate 3-dehydrogenase (decarboxylating)
MLTCTLRPSALYGERDGGMLYNIMRNYRAGRRRWQIGDGKNEFSQTYAGNSADAHLLAAAKLLSEHKGASDTSPSASSGKIAGEAILITDAYPVPYWDFGREVYRLAGDTTPIEDTWVVPKQAALWFAWGVEWFHWFRGDWPTLNRSMVRFTTMHRTYNITKAKELLGYTPAVDWKEGVRRSVEWYIKDEKEKQQ